MFVLANRIEGAPEPRILLLQDDHPVPLRFLNNVRYIAMMLSGKTALITGGGSGIGRATTIRFAEEGADVWIVGNDEATLCKTAEEIGPKCKVALCDVTDAARLSAIIDSLEQLDIVVSNAAVSFPSMLDEVTEAWRRMMEINLWGGVNVCLAGGRKMIRDGRGGRIITISSVLGQIAEQNSTAYGMAKAALIQFTKQLAIEWADHHILVNSVAPGVILTPMSFAGGSNETESDWFKQFYVHPDRPRIPLKRPGQPEEIAETILFFANPRNSYCTGQTLVSDGGLMSKF